MQTQTLVHAMEKYFTDIFSVTDSRVGTFYLYSIFCSSLVRLGHVLVLKLLCRVDITTTQ